MDTTKIDPAKISQQGLVVGASDAPITVTEFINLRCPYSKEWFEKATPILEPAIAAGRVKRVFKLFDKQKDKLKNGNFVQHFLPYDQPEQAYAAVRFLFAQQDIWGDFSEAELTTYMAEKLKLTRQPNHTMINMVLNEAKAANVQFVPTIIIGEQIFDEHITPTELAKLI
ncbi:thioredoxin domain-containing protein [Loigolactobacillus jiayinensis]|uniref:Thioredoxin domain-containing protein n=1 Tax=Loigolactobacillus jiayinensis TaxID=2486016 RepID=A0ABW1RBA7_9LACO|nr:thioredoxin domain-containing protein [Loigolactobacillus jiayinensis]